MWASPGERIDVWEQFLDQQHKYAFKTAQRMNANRQGQNQQGRRHLSHGDIYNGQALQSQDPNTSQNSQSLLLSRMINDSISIGTSTDTSIIEETIARERDQIEAYLQEMNSLTTSEERAYQEEAQRRLQKSVSSLDEMLATVRHIEEERQRAQELEKQQHEAEQRRIAAEKEAQLKLEAEKKRQEAEKEAQAKKEAQAAAEKRAKEAEKQKQLEARSSKEKEFISSLSYTKWEKTMEQLRHDVLDPIDNDKPLRKICLSERRKMTPKIGQLTNSAQAINKIVNELHSILEGARSSNQTAYLFLLNHLAKLLIRQAETESTANKATLFPLARVFVSLVYMGHGEHLANILMARLVKKCFWVTAQVPTPLPANTTLSDADKQKRLGHKQGETSTQYVERMAGILQLYAAILQVNPKECINPIQYQQLSSETNPMPTCFRPSATWLWLSLIVRMPIRDLEPAPFLIQSFLTISGQVYTDLYRKQAHKVLQAILTRIQDKSVFVNGNRAGTVRLESWIQDALQNKIDLVPGGNIEA